MGRVSSTLGPSSLPPLLSCQAILVPLCPGLPAMTAECFVEISLGFLLILVHFIVNFDHQILYGNELYVYPLLCYFGLLYLIGNRVSLI